MLMMGGVRTSVWYKVDSEGSGIVGGNESSLCEGNAFSFYTGGKGIGLATRELCFVYLSRGIGCLLVEAHQAQADFRARFS